jgi:dimethylhistidine N-methyltransferase
VLPVTSDGSTDIARAAARVAGPSSPHIAERYRKVRAATVALATPLSAEDQVVQSMPDASPVKWHQAHTTWYFETFLLAPFVADYRIFDPGFGYLFNSYYEAVGPRQPRPSRGLVTRPSLSEVSAYRRHVDQAMGAFLISPAAETNKIIALVELGLAHEEQHQELILMDVLHLFAQMPGYPAYQKFSVGAFAVPEPMRFIAFDGGIAPIGHAGPGFAFDNETPRHDVLLTPFSLADRLVTNGEWAAFIEDGGYRKPDLWLSDGWARVQAEGWTQPIYWEADGVGGWTEMTLGGRGPLDPNAPVSHVSFYEADAYARWRGKRLPTETEWEHAANADAGACLGQLYDALWQWTASPYAPYPGFRPDVGAVGEYNGKFMINQIVLRGGAAVTAPGHTRPTYRNFFYPHQRWQFSGVRLAEDVSRRPHPGSKNEFRRDVQVGLASSPKRLPSKYFYDERGSELFEAICELEEYYPTRQETALLADAAPQIAKFISPRAALIEFGSGASTKTRLILDAAPQIGVYIPMDISDDALEPAAAAIRWAYPDLTVAPLVGDFTQPIHLPAAADGRPRTGFFPGSTIGNFTPSDGVAFLKSARRLLGEGAQFIVGVDLVKDERVLVAAYDDARGVTAAFNLNLLTRLNRELEGDIDVANFSHRAVWNARESRMEMHLVSRVAQRFTVAGRTVDMVAGETIHTENSYKFTLDGFAEMAGQAGWRVGARWVSPEPAFAVFLLQAWR